LTRSFSVVLKNREGSSVLWSKVFAPAYFQIPYMLLFILAPTFVFVVLAIRAARRIMPSPIESLDKDTLQYILSFLCERTETTNYCAGLCAADWADTLLGLGRVNKYFRDVVSDDKLWGVWSAHPEEQVCDYGPESPHYDQRLARWKDFTLIKMAVYRARYYQRIADDELFLDEKGMPLFCRIIQRIACPYITGTERMEFRSESVDMLFVLVSEYLYQLLVVANDILESTIRSTDNLYPELSSKSIEVAMRIRGEWLSRASERGTNEGWYFHTMYSDDFNQHVAENENLPGAATCSEPFLNQENKYTFNHIIRRLAYKAGVIKLDNTAFELVQKLFSRRIADILGIACVEAEHAMTSTDPPQDQLSVTPAQLENANLILTMQSDKVTRKVYTPDLEESSQGSEEALPIFADQLDEAINELEILKQDSLENGELDRDGLSRLIAKLTAISIDDFNDMPAGEDELSDSASMSEDSGDY
jgi:hypothetical protein